jgi:acetylglutamate kinase
VDLGLVGDVTGVDARCSPAARRGPHTRARVPRRAASGQVYNINADTVANRVAVALGARGLVLVSDVPGVLRDVTDPSSRMASLTGGRGRALIARASSRRG